MARRHHISYCGTMLDDKGNRAYPKPLSCQVGVSSNSASAFAYAPGHIWLIRSWPADITTGTQVTLKVTLRRLLCNVVLLLENGLGRPAAEHEGHTAH